MKAVYELCDIILRQEKQIEMLEEECKALREQLYESDPDTAGFGIAAIKPNVRMKK